MIRRLLAALCIALALVNSAAPLAFAQEPPQEAASAAEEIAAEAPAAEETVAETPPAAPVEQPVEQPTEKPTEQPTEQPTEKPTEQPTEQPTENPTERPTEQPTEKPTERPTEKPTEQPIEKPTEQPTEQPTEKPTERPTEKPTGQPTQAATASATPTATQTPRPASRLTLTGVEVLDRDGHQVLSVVPGSVYDYVFSFADAGVLTQQAGRVTVTKEQDSFLPLLDTQASPLYDGVPRVTVLSGGESPLAFTAAFYNVQYSGEQKDFTFTVRYERLTPSPSFYQEKLDLCVLSRELTPVPIQTEAPESTAPQAETAAPETSAPEAGAPAAPNASQPQVSAPAAPVAPAAPEAPQAQAEGTPTAAAQTQNTAAPASDATATPAAAATATPAAGQQSTDAPQTGAPAATASPDPQQTPAPTEEAAVQPVLLISRKELPTVAAGQEFTVDIVFENIGKAAAELPVASFSVSDGLVLMEKATSFALDQLPPKEQAAQDPAYEPYFLRLHLKAKDEIADAQQFIDVKMKYEYISQSKVERGEAEEKVFITAEVTKKTVQAPLLTIGRTDFAAPVTANSGFDLTLWVKNVGNVTAENVTLSLSPSEAINLNESSSSRLIPSVAPGQTASVTVSMTANKEIQNATQSVQVDARYDFVTDRGAEQGAVNEKIMIPAVVKMPRTGGGGGQPKPTPEPSVPNVIISRYSYGAGQIAAGAEFKMELTFRNTSADQSVENILLTMETEEGLAITSASNTVYMPKMAPGQEETRTVNMQVLPTVKTGSVTLTAAFKYEYTHTEKRGNNTVTEKLSIPVYQPDRMSISAPTGPETTFAGEEATLSVAYFNKGRGEVYNLTAEIVGEVNALNRVQNIGNVEAGKSGSVDFIVVPQEEGVESFDIRLTYEDATQTVVQKSFPVRLRVEGIPMPEQTEELPGMPDQEEGGQGLKWYVYAAPGALAAGLAGLALRSRAKKRQKAKNDFGLDDLG